MVSFACMPAFGVGEMLQFPVVKGDMCGVLTTGYEDPSLTTKTISAFMAKCRRKAKSKVAIVFSKANGEMCGALTVADGGDRVSLMKKTISAFTAKCRNAVTTTTTTTKSKGDLMWPSGIYGLPMPTSGCPNSSGIIWETGSRYQDTEDTTSNNYWHPSTGIQLRGPYWKNNMKQNFCLKTQNRMDEAEGDWPQGKYCVFKYGQSCPRMMSSGFIYWDDEDSNNRNKVQGIVPSGVYDQDTRIEYCCMTGGNVSQPISLPTQDPFYLFPYNSEQCQAVKGMRATEEYFHWDEEDSPTIIQDKVGGTHPYQFNVSSSHGADNRIVYYCYYEPIDSLNRKK